MLNDLTVYINVDNPEIIDLRVLAKSLGDDIDLIFDFVKSSYLLSVRQGLSDIREAIAKSDVECLQRVGHKYKSSAKTVGALSLADLFLQLERLPQPFSHQQARDISDLIDKKITQIEIAIDGAMSRRQP